ncbi:arylesterase [Maribacter arenosus]|uniref:Arylesterase n=1 Tax=Maribacter arenosus TaxID=1854708 RepID=A0ABR7VDP2_9FLAO|nr:arylesterase [Maribacter arenosus]MBD0851056.1 arylesterase [Maribacter arenosus]
MQTLLKFSYFFVFILLISCGENKSKQESVDTEEVNIQSDTVAHVASKTIVFFGNSLTAGMGLDPNEAFPALIQKKLDSLLLDYKVINAGLSGETTASGKNRLNWVLNQKVDVFVLELGANDGLRGIPLTETRNNLQSIIDIVLQKNPGTEIVLAGMQIPPNMGKAYTTEFRNIFPELAEKNNAALIPFLLKDVAGVPALNQEDGIHPTTEGQKIVANNVWETLKDLVISE